MRSRYVLLFLLVALVSIVTAGCGGSKSNSVTGSDSVDVSSNEAGVKVLVTVGGGSEFVLSGEVDSGLTAIQSVDVLAVIETSYEGRFVSSIEGIASNPAEESDWFFSVNGIEPDVGAAEVKLSDGDVVWWDYRNWYAVDVNPAIFVGAFPKPFHGGWKGVVRPIDVIAPESLDDWAVELKNFLGKYQPDDPGAEPHLFELKINPEIGFEGAKLSAQFRSGIEDSGSKNGAPVIFTLEGSEAVIQKVVTGLISDPALIEHRYQVNFDKDGQVVASS